jgi:hypothetical protein
MTQMNKHKKIADETETATIEWQVLSPAYEVRYGSQFDTFDLVRDHVIVTAPNRREAIRLGTLEMLRQFPGGWAAENRAAGSPPFKGIVAEPLSTPEESSQWDFDEQDLHF